MIARALPATLSLTLVGLVLASPAAADDPVQPTITASPSPAPTPTPSKRYSRSHARLSGWQVDVHGGSMPAPAALTGASSLPPPGPTFGTLQKSTSQSVDWSYFGAGAALLNQVNASLTFPGAPLSALDPVLTTASVSRQKGNNFGVRIGHTITQYCLFEFNYDRNSGLLAITSDALNQIENTRSTYQTFLTGLNTNFVNGLTVTSISQINNDVGTERQMTGTASFNGGTYFGITPYFTVGGGILLQKGAPSFTLTGHNTFTTRTMFPFAIDETDAVSVAYSVDPAIVQVVGGGVRVFLTSRLGAQLDYRISTAKIGGGLKIKVSTAPVELPSTSPTNRGAFDRGLGPQVQFSDLGPSGAPSSLTNFQDDFSSFKSNSKLKTKALTVAFFFRF